METEQSLTVTACVLLFLNQGVDTQKLEVLIALERPWSDQNDKCILHGHWIPEEMNNDMHLL